MCISARCHSENKLNYYLICFRLAGQSTYADIERPFHLEHLYILCGCVWERRHRIFRFADEPVPQREHIVADGHDISAASMDAHTQRELLSGLVAHVLRRSARQPQQPGRPLRVLSGVHAHWANENGERNERLRSTRLLFALLECALCFLVTEKLMNIFHILVYILYIYGYILYILYK